MSYKPQPNDRKHKRLIGDAAAEAALAEQALDQLQQAARNDATRAHIRGIQIRVLRIDKLLSQMMEIARQESQQTAEY